MNEQIPSTKLEMAKTFRFCPGLVNKEILKPEFTPVNEDFKISLFVGAGRNMDVASRGK